MNYPINTLEQLRPILIGFRKSRGLSQKALAERLGISQQSYQALERAPQKATLARLFNVFAILRIKVELTDNACGSDNQTLDQDEW